VVTGFLAVWVGRVLALRALLASFFVFEVGRFFGACKQWHLAPGHCLQAFPFLKWGVILGLASSGTTGV
jgi:hypothetical protein